MTRLLFPFILFVSLAAAVMGMLNARHIFGIPASASTVFNIVSVISGVDSSPACSSRNRIGFIPTSAKRPFSAGASACCSAALAQLAIQLPSLWSLGFRFTWKLDFAIRPCAR